MAYARQVWLAALAATLAACAKTAPTTSARYQPRTRDVAITTVPLVTKELTTTYPFLKQDFAKGGVLDGKEVYAFMPSTVTVYAGDTLRLTLINPEDDLHSFVLPGYAVSLPGQSIQHGIWVAKEAGIFPFTCAIPAHLPMMHGEIVVLPDNVAPTAEPTK